MGEPQSLEQQLTPRRIVEELNKYIIGQHAAKRAVAIALRNRWRRQMVSPELREEIMPNNIILIGPTGVGKTEIARRLARLTNAPFIKVEASKYTEVGYVGRDVESMVRDLVEIAINQVKAEMTRQVQDKAALAAEERILDIIFPQKRNPEDEQMHQETREKLRQQLRSGNMDDRTIELELQSGVSPMMQVFGPVGLEDMGMDIQNMLSNMMPKRSKTRRVTIAEAMRLLPQEEAQKLIDFDSAAQIAIERVENSGIIFIDEIDKIAGPSSKGGGSVDVSREGVQRDLLPIVEGSAVNTKYGVVKTDHVLFIASGAFHIAKPSDLIPELQGRFPIRVELQSLSEDDFVKILTVPENALLKQYTALLATEDVEIVFSDDAIRSVAAIAAQVNENVENIGARRLHTILTTLLENILYDVPDSVFPKPTVITEELVHERLSEVVKNRDLTRYIL
jgi:ATP-dependent HslUV protease ATP-binding subunit HslU